MSTRSSYFIVGPFHVYREMMDDWVRVDWGMATLTVCPSLYWFYRKRRPRWFARLMCRLGKHAWWLDSWKPEWRYKCLKCGAFDVKRSGGGSV